MNIGFIPIRCGSKSIPFKNIKPINGKPLIYWSLNALQQAKCVDEVYVAVDCPEFGEVVSGFGFDKVKIYYRNSENAQDTSSTESVMLEFLEQQKSFKPSDHFFLVQATSPLIKSEDIDNAYSEFTGQKADSLLSCVRTKRFFWTENGTPVNYDHKHRPRRQDFDGMLMENGALYINSIKNIIETKNRLCGKIAIYEMPEYTAVEIDEEDDWVMVEKLMQRYL